MTPTREKSTPFYKLLEKIKAIHDAKGDAYEGSGRPAYANYKRLEQWVPALQNNPHLAGSIYAMMREEEKLARVRALLEGAQIGDENLEDTLLDMAVIPLIALLLYQEAQSGKANSKV